MVNPMEKLRVYSIKPEQAEPHPGNRVFESLGIKATRPDLVEEIRKGLSVSVISKMVKELDVSQRSLLKVLDVSTATLTRRRQDRKRLNLQESDRVYRIANVYRAAVQLFEGHREHARQWLNQPAKALDGHTPFELLDTEAGADEVLDLIGRLEHGVIT
jgi:putative toxin-antitoxin system antitoxin component (TIGR02293 family)